MSYEPQSFDILRFRKWNGLLNHFAIVLKENERLWVYEAFPPKVRRMPFPEHARLRLMRTSQRTVYRHDSLTLPQKMAIHGEFHRQFVEEVPYNWIYNFITADPNFTNCIEVQCDSIEKGFGPVWDRDHGRVTPKLFQEGIVLCGWRQL